MPTNDETRGEAPRERITSLIAAILRISASLDVGTVLREVVDSARALTGARYGVITPVDEAGLPQDFVTSGLSEDEHRRMASWLPDGLRLFEHLRDQEAPLRLENLPDYVRSLGLSPDVIPCRTFQGTPMRHRSVHVGNFFLGDKRAGQAFTDEDEEILVLFASQTAAAVANARTHRNEQRARADLEALVETSPVGVVMFDAETGTPVRLNREARRIVEALRMPGRSAEDLLDVLTLRLADGREVTLDQLRTAKTLRATEVELSVPDGRSIRMLVNATPIRPGDGPVESVVVTLQDLARLEELERMRAEFLSMVSQELRTPLTSIKGSTATLLGDLPGLDRAEMRQFIRIIDQQADHMHALIADLLDVGRIHAGTLPVDPEPVHHDPGRPARRAAAGLRQGDRRRRGRRLHARAADRHADDLPAVPKAVHFAELRARINDLLIGCGGAPPAPPRTVSSSDRSAFLETRSGRAFLGRCCRTASRSVRTFASCRWRLPPLPSAPARWPPGAPRCRFCVMRCALGPPGSVPVPGLRLRPFS